MFTAEHAGRSVSDLTSHNAAHAEIWGFIVLFFLTEDPRSFAS